MEVTMNKFLKNSLFVTVTLLLPVFYTQSMGLSSLWSKAGMSVLKSGQVLARGVGKTVKGVGEDLIQQQLRNVERGVGKPTVTPTAFGSNVLPQISSSQQLSPGYKLKQESQAFRGPFVSSGRSAPRVLHEQEWKDLLNKYSPEVPEIMAEEKTEKKSLQSQLTLEIHKKPLETQIVPVEQTGQLITSHTPQEIALSQELASRITSAEPNDNVQVIQGTDEKTGQEIAVAGIDIVNAFKTLLVRNERFIPESDLYRVFGINTTFKPHTEKIIDLKILRDQVQQYITPQQARALEGALKSIPRLESKKDSMSSTIITAQNQKSAIKITMFLTMDTVGKFIEQSLLKQEMKPVMPVQQQAVQKTTSALQGGQAQKMLMPAKQKIMPIAQKKVTPTWKETNKYDVEIKPKIIPQASVHPMRTSAYEAPTRQADVKQEQPVIIKQISQAESRLQLPSSRQIARTPESESTHMQDSTLRPVAAQLQQISHSISGDSSSMYEQKRSYFALPAETDPMPKRRGRPPKARVTSAAPLQTRLTQTVPTVEQIPAQIHMPEVILQQASAQPQVAELVAQQAAALPSQEAEMPTTVQTQPEAQTMTQEEVQRRGQKRGGQILESEIEKKAGKRLKTSSQEAELLQDVQRQGQKRGDRGLEAPEIEAEARPEKKSRTSGGSGQSSFQSSKRNFEGIKRNLPITSTLALPSLPGASQINPLSPTAILPQQEIGEAEPQRKKLRSRFDQEPNFGDQENEQEVTPQPEQSEQQNQPQEDSAVQEQVLEQENPVPQSESQQTESQQKNDEHPQPEKNATEEKEEPKKEHSEPQQIGSPSVVPAKEKLDESSKRKDGSESLPTASRARGASEPYHSAMPSYYPDMNSTFHFGALPPLPVVAKQQKKEPAINEWQERSPQESEHIYAALKTSYQGSQPTKQSRAGRKMQFIIPQEQKELEIIEKASIAPDYSFMDYVQIVLYTIISISVAISLCYVIRRLILQNRS